MDGLKFKTTLYLTPVPDDKALDVGVSPEIFRQTQIYIALHCYPSKNPTIPW